MIDVKKLEDVEYQSRYKANLKSRGGNLSDVDKILELNLLRKKFTKQFDESRAEQNRVGKEIALLKKNKQDASALLEEMQKVSADLKELDQQLADVSAQLKQQLLSIPNILHSSVPGGTSEADNKELRKWGEPKNFSFKVKDHVELGEALDIMDFERAGKIAGARFTFLKGAGARLEMGLINMMMDIHAREHGYHEMLPPIIINSNSLEGTGQFPKFKEDVFHLSDSDYYLSPTAEVQVTNYYAGEILKGEDLPKCFVAYAPCFRSEAGNYGKDTRGYIRQHQFNKVELVKFCHPDSSYEEHEKLTKNAETILERLELPYRSVLLCSADITFGAAKCHDLEVWLPSQNTYREISSCSNFEDFQARRANIRFKHGTDKPQFVHTLNGSGLAIGRTLVAIMENFQQEDGSILIPKALQSYVGGLTSIHP